MELRELVDRIADEIYKADFIAQKAAKAKEKANKS